MQNLRWPVVASTMAIMLAVLFGGAYLIRSGAIDQPLQRGLVAHELVESVQVEQISSRRVIRLKLSHTPDLERAYTDLDRVAKQTLKSAPYELLIEDRRTAELEQAYKRANLHVQEALVTGAFAQSAERVNHEADLVGATAILSVDRNRVYLQLKKGESYLYSVTDRRWEPQQDSARGGFGL